MAKAKITKIKEDQLFKNGSKKTILPITVGEAVKVNKPAANGREVLDVVLGRKLEWLASRVEDGNYHLYGFTNKENWAKWKSLIDKTQEELEQLGINVSPSKYVAVEVITGIPGSEVPELSYKALTYPINGSNYYVEEAPSGHTWVTGGYEAYIPLKGIHLINNIKIYSEQGKFKFAIPNSVGTTAYSSPLIITGETISLVNQYAGIHISVIPNTSHSEFNTTNFIQDRIIIESRDFSTVAVNIYYNKAVSESPVVVAPSEGSIVLSNTEDQSIKPFLFKAAHLTYDVEILTSDDFFITKDYDGQYYTNWDHNVEITKEQAEQGIRLYITCNTYYGNSVLSVPERSMNSSLTINSISNGFYPSNADFRNLNIPAIKYTYIKPIETYFISSKALLELGGPGENPTDLTTISYSNLTGPIYIQLSGFPTTSVDIEDLIVVKYKYNIRESFTIANKFEIPLNSSLKELYLGFSLVENFTSIWEAEENNDTDFEGVIDLVCDDKRIRLVVYHSADSTVPNVLVGRDGSNASIIDSIYNNGNTVGIMGPITSKQGLTEEEISSVTVLPANFCANVLTSQDNIPFTTADLSIFTNLKEIGDNAFLGCTNLTSVILPDGLEKIGRSAFQGTNITSIKVPNSVTNLGKLVFADCPNLTTIDLGERISTLPQGLMYNSPNVDTLVLRYKNGVVNVSAGIGNNIPIYNPDDYEGYDPEDPPIKLYYSDYPTDLTSYYTAQDSYYINAGVFKFGDENGYYTVRTYDENNT